MTEHFLYGVPAVTFTEAVDNFMAMQGNVRRSHYPQYLVTAKTVWEKMFKESIWEIKQEVVNVKVDSHKKKTFRLPCNMLRLLAISVVDKHGNLQPLAVDNNLNTLEIKCHPKTCSCTKCNGCETYCDAIDAITVRYESILLNNGQTYEKTIWTKKCGCDIIEVAKIPVWQDDALTWIETERTICDLEVDTNGCIKATEPNRKKLYDYFGWYPSCVCNNLYNNLPVKHHDCIPDLAAPQTINHYGYYKADADDPQLIHLHHSKAEQVIVTFQLAGAVNERGTLMIPKYALECFYFGMNYFITVFDKVTPANAKFLAEKSYDKAYRALLIFMNPIRMEEFLRLPSIPITWG